MLKQSRIVQAAVFGALTTLAPLQLLAGGFWLTLGHPSANPDSRAKNAFVVVRPDGCRNPAEATIKATAEGFVQGKRVTVPLRPVALAQPGAYAIKREWTGDGPWLVRIVGDYQGHVATALVPAGANGFERGSVEMVRGPASERQVTAALAKMQNTMRASK